MRSAGCIYNDWVDRDVDRRVTRTQRRPLAEESLQTRDALISFLFFTFGGFIVWLSLKSTTQIISLISLALLFIYPWAKRFTHFPQVILGLAFSLGVPMAACQVNSDYLYHEATWYLFFANVFFTTAYDIIYGFQDISDDKKNGNKSLSILCENYPKSTIGVLYGLTLCAWCFALLTLFSNPASIVIISIMALLLILILFKWSPHQPETCGQFFYVHHWIACLFFILCSLIRVIP